jgi:CHAT domain-containing protein
VIVSLVAGFTTCQRRGNPQAALEHARQTFIHGDLVRSQEEAEQGYRRFSGVSTEWAWKFRILEAESLLWRGMYQQVLTLLNSAPTRLDNDSAIEMLALEGVAHARLHHFTDAEKELDQAAQMCQASAAASCGNVTRARGVMAVQHGQIEAAKQLFEQSLQFARAHNDHFLEANALLNLGLTSQREGHFDESIDWTDAAYQASTIWGADDIAQMALGNLGWAYYNLGDSEKSLELSLEAENRATQVGDVIGQLDWITDTGYINAGRAELAAAKASYLKALDLATKINGREGIYNALRALALVSVENGELEEARNYSNQALAITHSDNNRGNELYLLFVNALIAAATNDGVEAERIFREVEQAPESTASLKWRAEHGLARLYENEGQVDGADREYRAALATFEAARSSLRKNEARLPFSSNASRIYDDYLHFLVAQGKTDEALRWADYSRARTLVEGLPPEQTPLNPQQIARRAKGTVLFYWLGAKQSYLWAITAEKIRLFTLPAGAEIEAAVERYRKEFDSPQDVLASGSDLGTSLYRMLIGQAKELLPANAKVIIVPDGRLNDLNFETLLVAEPKLHYWIEDVTLTNANSLRLLGSSHRGKKNGGEKGSRSLLLFGDAVAPSPEYPALSNATVEMTDVAKHFPEAKQRIFQRDQATPAAYLGSNPEQFSYIHFVAHGTDSRVSPLDSAIVLSRNSGENQTFKLYARDIIQHPVQAELVTISACYGAGTRAYSGEGLVGLSWAFLRAGAHSVIAALWQASDISTGQLMDKFYEELNAGRSPDAALRAAKLSLLHSAGVYRKPFYWAPFQLYTGS